MLVILAIGVVTYTPPPGVLECIAAQLTSALLAWTMLLVAILIARRFAQLSTPPLGMFLWKTGLVVLVVGAVSTGVAVFDEMLGFLAGVVVFVGVMVKLFDLDAWQFMVIVVAGLLSQSVALALLIVIGQEL